jgi:hypothetical protein
MYKYITAIMACVHLCSITHGASYNPRYFNIFAEQEKLPLHSFYYDNEEECSTPVDNTMDHEIHVRMYYPPIYTMKAERKVYMRELILRLYQKKDTNYYLVKYRIDPLPYNLHSLLYSNYASSKFTDVEIKIKESVINEILKNTPLSPSNIMYKTKPTVHEWKISRLSKVKSATENVRLIKSVVEILNMIQNHFKLNFDIEDLDTYESKSWLSSWLSPQAWYRNVSRRFGF